MPMTMAVLHLVQQVVEKFSFTGRGACCSHFGPHCRFGARFLKVRAPRTQPPFMKNAYPVVDRPSGPQSSNRHNTPIYLCLPGLVLNIVGSDWDSSLCTATCAANDANSPSAGRTTLGPSCLRSERGLVAWCSRNT